MGRRGTESRPATLHAQGPTRRWELPWTDLRRPAMSPLPAVLPQWIQANPSKQSDALDTNRHRAPTATSCDCSRVEGTSVARSALQQCPPDGGAKTWGLRLTHAPHFLELIGQCANADQQRAQWGCALPPKPEWPDAWLPSLRRALPPARCKEVEAVGPHALSHRRTERITRHSNMRTTMPTTPFTFCACMSRATHTPHAPWPSL